MSIYIAEPQGGCILSLVGHQAGIESTDAHRGGGILRVMVTNFSGCRAFADGLGGFVEIHSIMGWVCGR